MYSQNARGGVREGSSHGGKTTGAFGRRLIVKDLDPRDGVVCLVKRLERVGWT